MSTPNNNESKPSSQSSNPLREPRAIDNNCPSGSHANNETRAGVGSGGIYDSIHATVIWP